MKILATLVLVSIRLILSAQDVNQLPGKRAHHAMIYDESSDKVMLTGGSTPVNGGSSFIFYDDTWLFDGKSWTKVTIASDQRSGVALAQDASKKDLYSLGGFKNNVSVADLRLLTKTQWESVATLSVPGMTEGGFVFDSNRKVFVAFGGGASRGVVNGDTWEWNGKRWEKIAVENPPARQAFAMVYDEKRKITVLFGGMGTNSQNLFGDTWEYDGKSWKKVYDAGPAARMSAGYAYDSQRGMMIIFGGASANGILGDTWGWDGKEWKALATTGPAARMMGYLAYDKKRDRVVMFGGRLGWPNDANDTWEWNGTSWSEVK